MTTVIKVKDINPGVQFEALKPGEAFLVEGYGMQEVYIKLDPDNTEFHWNFTWLSAIVNIRNGRVYGQIPSGIVFPVDLDITVSRYGTR